MKIYMSRTSNEVRILTDSGEDITKDLGVTKITVSVEGGGVVRATLECEALLGFTGEVDYENIALNVNYTGREEKN